MQSTNYGFRLPLAVRIFLSFLLLIAVVLGSALYITFREGNQIAQTSVERALAASSQTQSQLTARRLEEAQLKVQAIANDPYVVQYISDSLDPVAELGLDQTPAYESDDPLAELSEDAAPLTDTISALDLLRERQQSMGFDLGILLDPNAQVLARTDQVEAIEANMSEDAFVLASNQAGLIPISGFWRQDQALFQAALMPLARDDVHIGFLLIALKVDDALATTIAGSSGAQSVFVVLHDDRLQIAASSLAATAKQKLSEQLQQASTLKTAISAGTSLERVDLLIDGERWVGRLSPLDANAGAKLGSELRLSSLDQAAAGYWQILNLLALVGGLSLLMALPLSYLLAMALLRPVSAMASAAEAAADGNYETRLSIRGNDQLARLSRAFDELLSSLREKSDIEGYVSNISRFLPDPAQAHTARSSQSPALRQTQSSAAPPQLQALCVLAIEFRALAKPLADGDPADWVERLQSACQQATTLAQRYGAVHVSAAGGRVYAAYEGEFAVQCAMANFRDLMGLESAASAMLEGQALFARLHDDQEQFWALLGELRYQADRLLAEATPGLVLLPKALGEKISKLLDGDSPEVVKGAASGRAYYGLGTKSLFSFTYMPGMKAVSVNSSKSKPSMQPSQGLAVGSMFGERYSILSVLGTGGMGVVYKALDIELDDVVALKTLKPGIVLDAEQLERLKSEIKLARKITHPNVLRTFDFGEIDGLGYISMEYVRGMTLRYLLKQTGKIPYSAALRIARQLVDGLRAAHDVGVLHRDIKPENVILESNGNAKLMDFGIARRIHRIEQGHTQPGMFVGTPRYCAPEQLAAEEVDNRADIFSCGVLMSEMFCGQLPYPGENTMEIYLAQMQSQPIKPSQAWPEIPPLLENLILKCILADKQQRFASADELALALAAVRV